MGVGVTQSNGFAVHGPESVGVGVVELARVKLTVFVVVVGVSEIVEVIALL